MKAFAKLLRAGTAVILAGPALADTALHSTEYYAGPYDLMPGCKSLALLSDDDFNFVLRLHGCEFLLANALPATNVGHEMLEDFNATRIGTAIVNDIGQHKIFLMASGAVDATPIPSAHAYPNGFACRVGDDLATIVTVEENSQKGVDGKHLGISVIQLSNDGEWIAHYDRGFEVAGRFKAVSWLQPPSKIACSD